MSDSKAEQDPSMEEILASIRKIISEDGVTEEDETEQQPNTEEEDVLELTDVIEDEDSEVADVVELLEEAPLESEPASEPEAPPEQEAVPELEAAPAVEAPVEIIAEPEPEPEPEPEIEIAVEEPAVEPVEAEPAPIAEDRIISDATAGASTDAFSELTMALHGEGKSGSGLALGEGDQTVEGIVRDLLRPMLREWLDANLPDLVHRLVRKEIKEMVRRAQDQ